ncbi:MAG: adenylate/guanylate cyclase domain-containing protein [Rhodocyclaceae bacterium]|nr:adenylate/guanylate cyclase domain-containing protein [Rhodocyclaceae bacterium]
MHSDATSRAAPPASVSLRALDHGNWLEVQNGLRQVLAERGMEALTAPITLIVHDLLDVAIKLMHRCVFRDILANDLGLDLEGNDEQLEALLRTELTEHGPQNLANACQSGGWQIRIDFPNMTEPAEQLLRINLPTAWDAGQCQTGRLIEVLGLELDAANDGSGAHLTLACRADRQPAFAAPTLLDTQARLASLGRIVDQLGYGLIRFSAVGEVLAVSPSMLDLLRLEAHQASVPALAAAIPLNFHNDITWGLALAGDRGAFENYRIRVRLPGAEHISTLFNVSGFRDVDGSLHSLWQAVSQDEGSAQLSEGSILSEVRIHNITRNYVPQLVERKARDAVRLGKSALANEERPVAVLFCDIVGFTAYVESNAENESVIDTLNSILRRISGSVRRNNGSIDKFMGDCIMALFDDPADAVFAASDMQRHADDINGLRSRAGQQELHLRIGIHWGEVVIGNVGTAERLDWTAIGDVVNTASRIEKGCQPGSILISTSVKTAVEASHPGEFQFGETFGLQVKGKQDALLVCHVSPAQADEEGFPGHRGRE